jgi:hypothetical protein
MKRHPLVTEPEVVHTKIKTWSDLANTFLAQYRFNMDIAPDRFELQRMQKKPTESFRVYAHLWREVAAQVKPPMLGNGHYFSQYSKGSLLCPSHRAHLV